MGGATCHGSCHQFGTRFDHTDSVPMAIGMLIRKEMRGLMSDQRARLAFQSVDDPGQRRDGSGSE